MIINTYIKIFHDYYKFLFSADWYQAQYCTFYILFALRIGFFLYHFLPYTTIVPLLIFINIYYQELLNYVTTQTKIKKFEMKNEMK